MKPICNLVAWSLPATLVLVLVLLATPVWLFEIWLNRSRLTRVRLIPKRVALRANLLQLAFSVKGSRGLRRPWTSVRLWGFEFRYFDL